MLEIYSAWYKNKLNKRYNGLCDIVEKILLMDSLNAKELKYIIEEYDLENLQFYYSVLKEYGYNVDAEIYHYIFIGLEYGILKIGWKEENKRHKELDKDIKKGILKNTKGEIKC